MSYPQAYPQTTAPSQHQADVGGDETVSEEVSKEVFSSYRTTSFDPAVGKEHPGEISEASSLR